MADGSVTFEFKADDSEFQKTVDGLGDEARTAAEGMNELGDSGEKVKDSLGAADVAAGSLVANGLSALVSGAMDAVGALIELADSTREYRVEAETPVASAGRVMPALLNSAFWALPS